MLRVRSLAERLGVGKRLEVHVDESWRQTAGPQCLRVDWFLDQVMRDARNAPSRIPSGKLLAGATVDPQRSALMARVRGKDSKPEIVVRRSAHALGYRFRLHRRNLPGTPDLVFPRLRKAIFVHGCFWHRHRGCSRTTTPKTRAAFWAEKFADNIKRDARTRRQLRAAGWDVLVVWECETFDRRALTRRLAAFLVY
jgi:DNA mismatch endonuclease (patch repair protein)